MIEKFVQTGIINPHDVSLLQDEAISNDQQIVFIDATFVLPTSNENIHENYIDKRIPGAIFFDIKKIADKSSPLPQMLPDENEFGKAVSELGIHNDDIIIIYAQHGMIMGPARVWWMFRGFGHNNVLVLNGSFPAWEKAGLDIESGTPAARTQSAYSPSPFNLAMVVQMSEVFDASIKRSHLIIDARPAQRFKGQSPEPREEMRAGNIPNSANIPCSSLVDENGQFRPPEQIEDLFESCGVFIKNEDVSKSIITTCGSGITACALALALYHIDRNDVAVYDGSWSEWGLESSGTPIATT